MDDYAKDDRPEAGFVSEDIWRQLLNINLVTYQTQILGAQRIMVKIHKGG